jgi:hypothetical protein
MKKEDKFTLSIFFIASIICQIHSIFDKSTVWGLVSFMLNITIIDQLREIYYRGML